MADNKLAQAQQLVDQLTPHDQVRLLAYLTIFQLGDMLTAADTPERETLTAGVLAMRR